MKDPIIRTKQDWKNLSIVELDASMKKLIESRKILLDNRLLTPELEALYKQTADTMFKILKEHQKKND